MSLWQWLCLVWFLGNVLFVVTALRVGERAERGEPTE
jgi:hypothetical protein